MQHRLTWLFSRGHCFRTALFGWGYRAAIVLGYGSIVSGCASSNDEDGVFDSSTATGGSDANDGDSTGGLASGAASSGGSSSGGSLSTGGSRNTGGFSATGGTETGGQNGATGGLGSGGQPTGGSGGQVGSTGGQGSSAGGTATQPDPDCTIDLECQPAPLPSTGDFSQDCVNRINQFRVGCYCLPALERWTEAEVCATENAEYDQEVDMAHAGWVGNQVCGEESGDLAAEYNGSATNECPRYGSSERVISGCLSAMYAEGAQWAQELGRAPEQSDYTPCADDFDNCYVHYGHFIAMTNENFTQVACGITADEPYWSVQNFR